MTGMTSSSIRRLFPVSKHIGYAARPIVAFFMGHIGGKYGHKMILIFGCEGPAGP
jgi:hypothetical protein